MSKKFGVIFRTRRLVMLDDLVETGDIMEQLPFKEKAVFKNRPSRCPDCDSKEMAGIEIMGSYDGILLWECDDCESMFLRFSSEETKEYLESAKGVWTNPHDWGFVPKSEFN